MHTKRYNKLSLELCRKAVIECFRGKWRRNDVLTFIEKYTGIPRDDIKIEALSGAWIIRTEAVESIALALLGVIEDLEQRGIEPEDMEPPAIRQRPDGMTGKVRDIALLCILHQLLGHVTKLMLEPLFHARILPTQHASMPGHGQTRLKDQVHRYFLRESLGVVYFRKTDVKSAYKSLQYSVCLDLIRAELPKATTIFALMEYLGRIAPGGHLIIGGYLDAWLFNFAMSYAVRHLFTLGYTRRGKAIPYVIRCDTFMDDFVILSGSVKGQVRSVKALDKWLMKHMDLNLKETTGIVKLLPIEEEKRRRSLPRPAQRGVPMLDMAGYRISRTHVTIRRKVFKRTRRQLLRGWDELQRTGTLRRGRAQKIISYNSYIEQSDSFHLKEKYHVVELVKAAKRVCSFYGWLDAKKRKEVHHALQERRRGSPPGAGDGGAAAERGNICPAGGQHHGIHSGGNAGTGDVPF